LERDANWVIGGYGTEMEKVFNRRMAQKFLKKPSKEPEKRHETECNDKKRTEHLSDGHGVHDPE